MPDVPDSMTYIEAVPDTYSSLISITYIEAVPELEAGINTGLCYRGDQTTCVPWVPSIFALWIVSLLHGETIFGLFNATRSYSTGCFALHMFF